ncbi:uncharacterized protein (DUF885 family) [Aquimarina sp. EL_43]|uniref:DUF885 domain-containing protein n=1 Tax=unclassified Aquimarina TaxID=2627091 RepID=UPI0018CA5758|nr:MULTISPECIES: DUF885 domain-containing protein [unclassified Aquimarina]MBG6132160.1 uncharacterized protein (DUF885 family) [Aquimarina sp. EL_35]MBG6152957.1 uncharacterized protein (DUF885 family) [Aquimarina sp. EL_32]MBG6170964.1 uncharacterized protein (DUF885 family) [Aquimarina sp. EL_43]
MTKIKISVLLFSSFLALTGCKQEVKAPEEDTASQAEIIEEQSKKLNDWFEAQFQQEIDKSPMMQTYLGIKTDDYGKWDDISSKQEAEDLERAKERLAYLKDSVDVSQLNDATALSYKLMKKDLENEIADFQYRFYDYPVNQMFGMQSRIPAFLINMHKIKDKNDAEAYISRLNGVNEMFTQAIENIKIREKNGILPPKFVFAKVLDDSRNIIAGQPFDKSNQESTLLADFKSKISTLKLSDEEQSELVSKAEKGLVESVKPAYDNLITLLEGQQQRATTDDGCWKFPKGAAFYDNALQRTTTTTMTADQIHELGLKEVARIHNEMRDIMKQVKYEGTLQDFFKYMKEDKKFYFANTEEGKAAYLKQAVGLIDTMKSKLDELFITKPKADIIVKAVEPFREKSAGKAFYQSGTPDGSRPGTYYANLYDMTAMPIYQMEALAYHEGIPGHHMQRSIAQELQDIPKFRKFGGYTAYTEGWGLYTELLPKEIGMYSDPYSDFGRLAMELWRACRLVVDTGIHSKKWSREEGIKYYVDNTPNAESDAVKMVERHIVMPSQATAYKIGMIKILELRENARKTLGDAFDIREFHDVVLTNGAVPLTILEELIGEWVASKSADKTKEEVGS